MRGLHKPPTSADCLENLTFSITETEENHTHSHRSKEEDA